MNQSVLKLRSTVPADLLRYYLYRGILFAGIGVLLLGFAGSFMPVSVLQFWGLPIFLGSFALMIIGLLPYKRLKKLEMKPNEIILTEGGALFYVTNGKAEIRMNVNEINSVQFVQNRDCFGILLKLKSKGDFFLPYFSARSTQELQFYLINDVD